MNELHLPNFLKSFSCCEIRNTKSSNTIDATPPINKSLFELDLVVFWATCTLLCCRHPDVAPQIVFSCSILRQSLFTSVSPTKSKLWVMSSFLRRSNFNVCFEREFETKPKPPGLCRRILMQSGGLRVRGSPKYPPSSWFRHRLLSVVLLFWDLSHERGVPGQRTRGTGRPKTATHPRIYVFLKGRRYHPRCRGLYR